ncbi:unnamed protein product [Caenorhabditis sp. 36 PRJEB53466]|nr:unnamed protein product [Caenorhabditis sp. 36 PRJEB53466]
MVTDLRSLPIVKVIGEPLDETLETVVESIQFSIFCFTLPFYLFVTYIMLNAQLRGIVELSTPFFKLCITTAVVDICGLLNNYLGAMFPKWSWGTGIYLYLDHFYAHAYLYFAWALGTLLNNYLGAMFPKWSWGTGIYLYLDHFYAHAYLYFAWTSGICQAMCVSVLATNRLSAIMFPNKHNIIWSSTRLRIAMSLQFIPGMLAGLATLFNGTQLYRNNKNGVVPKFIDEKQVTFFFLVAGAFLTIVCIYLISAYCYLLYVLRKNSNAIKNTQFRKARSQIKKREFKLFIMSSITVAIQIAALCLFVSYATGILVISLDKFYLLYNGISDLYAGINPYLLWIFSDSLRKHILIWFGFKQHQKQPSSSVITVIH